MRRLHLFAFLVLATSAHVGCKKKSAPAIAITDATSASDAAPAKVTIGKARVPVAIAALMQAIVDAPDRTDADRALDEGRHPAELLTFLAIEPGMHVAELTAGGGYTTELLARAVGPSGRVHGQNSSFVLERFAEKPWTERLARPINTNVVRADRELDDPLPPEAKDLDLVVSNLVHHDFYWQKVDRAKMHAALLAALKPGGRYVLIDHSARPGAGATEVETLHRIEESEARRDAEAAGFKLSATSDFLRNPDDTLDWSTSPRTAGEKRGTSDRFALVFTRP